MEIIKNLTSVMEESLTSILEESKNNPYTVKKVPVQLSEADEKINEILDCYITLSQDEQDQINKSVTYEMARLLLVRFGIRMATYALRLVNQQYFTNGLVAIGMTLRVMDIRDILVILPLFCDAQKKNNLSFDGILNQNNELSSVLEDFINRDEKDKSLECMGYTLATDENNKPIYQRTW